MEVYADYAATTNVAPDVVTEITEVLSNHYGNASSIHNIGRAGRSILDQARLTIAKRLNATPREIIFTSGATESNNLAIKGVAYKNQHKGKHLITTSIEHHSVLHVFAQLEKEGFEVTYLPVDARGFVSTESLKQALREDTIFVSIMFGNNEVGTVQPIDEIAELLKGHQAIFHTDGVQTIGHMPIDLKALNVDLFTLTAHKFYGPKGVGLLYVKDKTPIEFQQLGGAQETKRRAGTENIAYIAGMAKALVLATVNIASSNIQLSELKQEFINALQTFEVPFELNGDMNMTLPHIINLYFPFSDVEKMLTILDMNGVYVSSGSACTAGSIEPSHVLTSMFGEHPRTKQSIRFSFSHQNTVEEIKYIAEQIKKIYEMNRKE
ncbi:cysteine desulfurase family protein [Macrococcoides caseolyticum]|uniref:cysteine desulfurase family protein n=1 Tax=Macrococcoides caseolyticum TaxID=69966 RepID=UPI001F33160C|nr:cysteine desulfurase family protein [Macrococcus caseolyticus]MCE4956194.1 cysteine desulfurase [Macrococcus caseolyticus]